MQYQYLPLLTSVLALLYYTPHVIFNVVNADLITLRDNLKQLDGPTVLRNYFDYNINTRLKVRMRVLGNVLVNLFYVGGNLAAWFSFDVSLRYRFVDFGWRWMQWVVYEPDDLHLYGTQPAQALLPTFGLCKVG